jgi:hypothetical protein
MRSPSTLRRIVAVLAMLSIAFFGGSVGRHPQAVRAQDRESPAQAAARLQQATGNQVSIRFAEATGVARFIRAADEATLPTGGGNLQDKAFGFLTDYGALLGVENAGQQLRVTNVTTDPAGSTVRLAQRHAA